MWTSNVRYVIKNIFSYGFSVMESLFVKSASGGPGFKIKITLRDGYGYRAGHTGSWAVRFNKISASVIFSIDAVEIIKHTFRSQLLSFESCSIFENRPESSRESLQIQEFIFFSEPE